jgi:hypothetical protein
MHVALISKYDIEPNVTRNTKFFLGSYYWSSIHKIIKKYIKSNKLPKNDIVCQFLSFMESKGMDSVMEINKVKYSTWLNFYQMNKTLRNILTETQKNIKNHNYEVSRIRNESLGAVISFNFFPRNKKNKFLGKGITPSIGIYLFNKKIWKEDHYIDDKPDIYAYVELWNNMYSFKYENTKEINKNIFF